MKERPIIFTPENGQKIHEGTKTQTRRIMKPQPPEWCTSFGYTCFTPKGSISGRGTYEDKGPAEKFFKCPYGVVGDRLWIREAFRLLDYQERKPGPAYKGEGIKRLAVEKWTPSIHMPRWACRTVVELTEIRVELVQEISEEDAKAEGVSAYYGIMKSGNLVTETSWTAVEEFKKLWESINGPGSWERNDWVWVLSFRKVTA